MSHTALDAVVCIEDRQGIKVLSLLTHDLDSRAIDDFDKQARRLVQATPGVRLVVDMSRVAHTPSRFLGVLVDLQHGVTQAQGQLRISALRGLVMNVFLCMGLDRLLQTSSTLEEALESLRSQTWSRGEDSRGSN